MMKIAVIGDSTVEWIRPYRNHINDFTYSELLNKDITVDIYVKPGMTSHDALILIWQQLMGKFYDYYIFSFGINDCTPRSYPKAMADYYNKVLIPQNSKDKLFFLFYKLFTSTKIQTICSKLNISRPWVNTQKFNQNIERIIELLTKETDAKICFLTIPQTSSRVTDILKDINHFIPQYSDIIRNKHSSRVFIIDVDSLFKKEYDLYIPEGIHYSSKGHDLIYNEILSLIKRRE